MTQYQISKDIVDKECQIAPRFETQRCYVKVSAGYIYEKLILSKTYQQKDFCLRSINNILNRHGHTLKKVLKTRPLKKIAETDAIFENVYAQHRKEEENKRILWISIDVKAKVKIGYLSRGGYARTEQAPIADDHDQHWTDVSVPFGLHEINTGHTFLMFGNSKEILDFIVDCLIEWWQKRYLSGAVRQGYDMLMIDLDNGRSVAGNTKQFLKRMTGFAQMIQMPIQLVYYPPYHSKYNIIERFWAALENYWSAVILDTVQDTINVAKKAVWKDMYPIVSLVDKTYRTGIKVNKEEIQETERFIQRNPKLKKWDFRINWKTIESG